ncbi:MAG: hypothetical protein HC830_07585, partial [Bacteroidetes bacterium]|nr:hypothetical protein [Bacteroidota bacterium]
EHCDIDFYAGTLMMHGMSEFALLKGNEDILEQTMSLLGKFGTGEIKAKGNFISYEAGGSGPAYLAWKRVTDKIRQTGGRCCRKNDETPKANARRLNDCPQPDA